MVVVVTNLTENNQHKTNAITKAVVSLSCTVADPENQLEGGNNMWLLGRSFSDSLTCVCVAYIYIAKYRRAVGSSISLVRYCFIILVR